MVKNLNIIKRDGSIVKFNKCKIEDAILKAMKYGSGIYEEEIAKKIADEIEISCFEKENSPTVYQVENMVYNKLIEYKHELTAKAYEGYRAVQSFKREVNTTDDSIIGEPLWQFLQSFGYWSVQTTRPHTASEFRDCRRFPPDFLWYHSFS